MMKKRIFLLLLIFCLGLGGCGKNHSGVRVMAAGVDAGIFSVDNKRKGVHIGAEHDCGPGSVPSM